MLNKGSPLILMNIQATNNLEAPTRPDRDAKKFKDTLSKASKKEEKYQYNS